MRCCCCCPWRGAMAPRESVCRCERTERATRERGKLASLLLEKYEGRMITAKKRKEKECASSLSSLAAASPHSFHSELHQRMDSDDDAPPLQGDGGALLHAGGIDAALAAYGVPGVEQPGGAATQLPPSVSNSSAAAAALAAAAANGGKIPRGSTGLGGPPPGARGGGPSSAPGGSVATGSDDPPGPKPDVCAFFWRYSPNQAVDFLLSTLKEKNSPLTPLSDPKTKLPPASRQPLHHHGRPPPVRRPRPRLRPLLGGPRPPLERRAPRRRRAPSGRLQDTQVRRPHRLL